MEEKRFRHISLFSGMGGFDLASQWMGWENVAHCEFNEFLQRILKYYWPYAKSHSDITTTDFSVYRGKIDILTGGFPCQPYSIAGQREGTEDNRHLWPEMLRAIREIQPTWIVGENVRGLTNWNGGMVFDEVQSDLENEGYEVTPFLLPAAGIDAPHERYRIWFIAYSGGNRSRRRTSESNGKEENTSVWTDLQLEASGFSVQQPSPNSNCSELQRVGKERDSGKEGEDWKERKRIYTGSDIQPDWKEFPTQSPLCSGNDGLSSRLDGITFSKFRKQSIKAGGNAIVPQLALQIFKAIETYNHIK